LGDLNKGPYVREDEKNQIINDILAKNKKDPSISNLIV